MSSEGCANKAACMPWTTTNTYIKIDNVVVTTLSGLGIYIAIVTHSTGKLDKVRYFDTHAGNSDSLKLFKYLKGLQHGKIVLGISYGDGATSLSSETRTLLVS